jgi:hypothetical protein
VRIGGHGQFVASRAETGVVHDVLVHTLGGVVERGEER